MSLINKEEIQKKFKMNIPQEELDAIEEKVKYYIEELSLDYKLKNLALELSDYNSIYKTLKELPREDVKRILLVDWFDINTITCSGRHLYDIRKDFVSSLTLGDEDRAIGHLNEVLGNCCISSIDDL